MANNYRQPGDVLTWTNGTGSAVASGQVVKVGQTLGVALVDIANGASGSVAISGVFVVPKSSAAIIAQGDPVMWDVSAGNFDAKSATPATGDVSGGSVTAFEAAGNGTTSFRARFNGIPGTVA